MLAGRWGGPPVEFVQLDRTWAATSDPPTRGRARPASSGLSRRTRAAAAPAWDIVVGPDVEAFKNSVRAFLPDGRRAALDQAREDGRPQSAGCSTLCRSTLVTSPRRGGDWGRRVRTLPQLPRLHRLGTMPAEKYFERLFPGPELAGLRAALFTLAPIAGMPAIGPLVMLGTGLRGRLYSPRGGSQVLADAFARGGRRATGWRSAIRHEARRHPEHRSQEVQGVLLDDRSELHAPAVVSAIDAKQTFYRLLSPDRMPESFSKLLESQPVSEPYALISAVTTLEPATLGFDGTDVFVCPSVDVSRALESKEPEECGFLLVFPQYREPGSDPTLRALQIVAPSSYAWREHWET